jgi:hypothetical protein
MGNTSLKGRFHVTASIILWPLSLLFAWVCGFEGLLLHVVGRIVPGLNLYSYVLTVSLR